MTMTKKYKILSKFVKDMSSETPNVETYLHVKDNISKYHLNIDISSKAIKNKLIETSTKFSYLDPHEKSKKAFFEIIFATIIKVEEDVENKKDLEKIILCDVQNEIYPKLEKAFINLINDSGFPGIKIEKKIDFNRLYQEKFN